MNPFNEKPVDLINTIDNWTALYPRSYNKNDTDPFTKTRIILMNGTEFEAVGFSHNFSRNTDNNDLRRDLAMLRRSEQSQQKTLSCLKPKDESILEHTISYEQLAVDLTAILAKREPDVNVKNALDFALLEDFDHLYRYADLLEMDRGIYAEQLVGGYTEIMPGRPTISEHRHPFDNIKYPINCKEASPITRLNVAIITAAEQQTMNYYMNIAGFYENDIGRKLYQEIGLIEEQHVSQYGSLIDPRSTFLEKLLDHEYTECYLYYSCYEDEKDPMIKGIWEQFFVREVAHLHKAADLLMKYEHKHWQQLIPDGRFPELLKFSQNIDYVRDVINRSLYYTSNMEDYEDARSSRNERFISFQHHVNKSADEVPSHVVIKEYIQRNSQDYRYEVNPHPTTELRDRTTDNTTAARECVVEMVIK
ncbi:MAG: hypothetical protein E7218_08830 [Anaerofustis stercorihominis]|nr:hypothetical protein [Anaerofustis stercorihominis]